MMHAALLVENIASSLICIYVLINDFRLVGNGSNLNLLNFH